MKNVLLISALILNALSAHASNDEQIQNLTGAWGYSPQARNVVVITQEGDRLLLRHCDRAQLLTNGSCKQAFLYYIQYNSNLDAFCGAGPVNHTVRQGGYVISQSTTSNPCRESYRYSTSTGEMIMTSDPFNSGDVDDSGETTTFNKLNY